jgi:murein DD-endopeptidase MepM/ murein hydrolase activator NlpD
MNSNPVRRDRQSGATVFSGFLVALSLSIVGVGLISFAQLTHTNPLSPNFLEEHPPTLEWSQDLRGLGAEPATLALRAQDAGAGLDEVVVRISQNNQPQELVRRSFREPSVTDETIEITVDPKTLGLREGNAELQVSAFDKSLWNNGAQISKIVEINFAKPQISAITPQQNGVLGGAELVFYRITGKAPNAQGVASNDAIYPGFKAEGWDEKFKGRNGVYIAFYPIPQTFDDSNDSMKLVARDNLGNSASSSFNYRIKQRRWSSFRVQLTEQQATQLKERFVAYASKEKLPVKLTGALADDMKVLLRTLAFSDDGFVDTALSEPSAQRLWRDAFIAPVPSAPNNSTGDQRIVYVGDKEIVRGPAAGVRFPVSRRTQVVAANSGKVVFIGELGLLGNTIIIDHGFGLSTLYGHLSDVKVQRGVSVQKGQEIGQTGTTGFAQSEEVYFEVRLHDTPVAPNEWWDQSWVTDHIENKVQYVLRDAV